MADQRAFVGPRPRGRSQEAADVDQKAHRLKSDIESSKMAGGVGQRNRKNIRFKRQTIPILEGGSTPACRVLVFWVTERRK